MASKKEIDINYKLLKKELKNNFAFLKCSSSYPASINDLNLNTIDKLKEDYNCPIGYSDHSVEILLQFQQSPKVHVLLKNMFV